MEQSTSSAGSGEEHGQSPQSPRQEHPSRSTAEPMPRCPVHMRRRSSGPERGHCEDSPWRLQPTDEASCEHLPREADGVALVTSPERIRHRYITRRSGALRFRRISEPLEYMGDMNSTINLSHVPRRRVAPGACALQPHRWHMHRLNDALTPSCEVNVISSSC